MMTVATYPGTMQHCWAEYDLCSWIGKVLASQASAAVPDLLTKLPVSACLPTVLTVPVASSANAAEIGGPPHIPTRPLPTL